MASFPRGLFFCVGFCKGKVSPLFSLCVPCVTAAEGLVVIQGSIRFFCLGKQSVKFGFVPSGFLLTIRAKVALFPLCVSCATTAERLVIAQVFFFCFTNYPSRVILFPYFLLFLVKYASKMGRP